MSEQTLLKWLHQRGKPVPPTKVPIPQETGVRTAKAGADGDADDVLTAWSDLEASAR